ncbi:MAG: heme-binding protein [Chloroflexi bacterium]|nr:heme-binding protein [Chloroflexota bacterium]MDA1174204.1 heme-binding protein [Chloroflexota bacterium]
MINELVIGHADARLVAQAILDAAGTKNKPIAVAVVDNRGDVVYLTRQDGTSAVDVRNAERKAYTAAFIGRDTALWRQQIAHDGRTVADWSDANTTTLHGGWTLRRQSQVIGGIGVAGTGDEDRDEQLALKGAEAAAQISVDEWLTKRDPRIIRDR